MRINPKRGTLAVVAVLLTTFGAVAAVSAAGNTLRIEPASNSIATGASFTVRVVGNTSGPVVGAQAAVAFDNTQLQIQSIAKGADWVSGGAVYGGYPSPANMSSFIGAANAAGKLPGIAAFISDGSSFLAAGDHDLLSITFKATACGTSSLSLPVGPADATMIDGAAASYGNALPVTTTAGSVSVACAGSSPSASPSGASASPSGASPSPSGASSAPPDATPKPADATPTPASSGAVEGTTNTPPPPPATDTVASQAASMPGSWLLVLIGLAAIGAGALIVSWRQLVRRRR